jgi:hypothetical protein
LLFQCSTIWRGVVLEHKPGSQRSSKELEDELVCSVAQLLAKEGQTETEGEMGEEIRDVLRKFVASQVQIQIAIS